MAKEFMVGNVKITIPGDIVEYNTLRQEFIPRQQQIVGRFRDNLFKYKDLDEIVNNCRQMGYGLICELYGYFGQQLINRGNYDFNQANILQDKSFGIIKSPFISVLEPVIEAKRQATAYKESEQQRREYRKESRGRVVGGGFGLKGALTGMAEAGAINATTGLAHGAWNLLGNAMTSVEVASMENKIFENCKEELVEGFANSASRVLGYLAEKLEINVRIDNSMTEDIARNINSGVIRQEDIINAFKECIQKNPYATSVYLAVLDKVPEQETAILKIAKFFSINLGANYCYDGFVFSKRENTALARQEDSQLGKIVDANTAEGVFSTLSVERLRAKFGITMINYLLYLRQEYYANNPTANEGIKEYRDYQIQALTKARNDIMAFYAKHNYIVGKEIAALQYDKIALQLQVADMNKEVDYFYYGNIVPQDKYAAFCAEAKVDNPKSRIYLFAYDNDTRDRFLLNQDGFYYKSMFSTLKIAINSIKNIRYKENLGSSSLRVNSTDVDFNCTKEEVKRAATVLNGIISEIREQSATAREAEGQQQAQTTNENVTHQEVPVARGAIANHSKREKIFSKQGLFSLTGRRSRKEFIILYCGCATILGIILLIAENSIGINIIITCLLLLVEVVILWIVFANVVKRTHDLNYSGWWIILFFVLSPILFFKKGIEATSEYGPDPLEQEDNGENAKHLKYFIIAIVAFALVSPILFSFFTKDKGGTNTFSPTTKNTSTVAQNTPAQTKAVSTQQVTSTPTQPLAQFLTGDWERDEITKYLYKKGMPLKVLATSNSVRKDENSLSFVEDSTGLRQFLVVNAEDDMVALIEYNKRTYTFNNYKAPLIFTMKLPNDKRDADTQLGLWQQNDHYIPIYANFDYEYSSCRLNSISSGSGIRPSHYQGPVQAPKNVRTVKIFFQKLNTLRKDMERKAAQDPKLLERRNAKVDNAAAAMAQTDPAEQKKTYPAITMQAINKASASSFDKEDGYWHSADLTVDGNITTCWSEGVKGTGVGESLTYNFDRTYKVSGFNIWIGHQKSEYLFHANARPKRIRIKGSNGYSESFKLQDTMGRQRFTLAQPIAVDAIKLVIERVTPGTKYEDTCIAEVSFF